MLDMKFAIESLALASSRGPNRTVTVRVGLPMCCRYTTLLIIDYIRPNMVCYLLSLRLSFLSRLSRLSRLGVCLVTLGLRVEWLGHNSSWLKRTGNILCTANLLHRRAEVKGIEPSGFHLAQFSRLLASPSALTSNVLTCPQ